VAVAPQPAHARVVLHGAERGVVALDPDLELAHLRQPVLGDEDRDPLQMIREHPERARALVGVLARQHVGVDVDGPALDLFQYGIEADAPRALGLGAFGLERDRLRITRLRRARLGKVRLRPRGHLRLVREPAAAAGEGEDAGEHPCERPADTPYVHPCAIDPHCCLPVRVRAGNGRVQRSAMRPAPGTAHAPVSTDPHASSVGSPHGPRSAPPARATGRPIR
jgi:hypothetical protein